MADNSAGHYIFPVVFSFFFLLLSFFLPYSQRLQIGCLAYHTDTTHDVALVRI